jgi:hypothetical protein
VRGGAALGVLAAAVYLWTAPGRVQFPDDEIVLQTAVSLYDDGDLTIAGIRKRTGEPEGRPTGTFGWAPGADGQRYGFFGHGLSLVAVPLVALAEATVDAAPREWPHAVRSDHHALHRRNHRDDWLRLVVGLINCFVTGAAVWLLAVWVRALGFTERTALATGAAYAFATTAWAYSRTMLSEPLSGLCFVAAGLCVTRGQAARGDGWLWLAGAIAGFSVHVHVLNLVFVPCIAGLAIAGRRSRRGLVGAAAMLTVGVAALMIGQWWRFGDPLETGRFGYYSHFVAPWEGLAALVIAPGRSVFLYAPAVLLGLFGWAALRRRAPEVCWFAGVAILLRWAAISTRSDWFGGWGLGARHLVPVIPLAMLAFAATVEDVLPRWRSWTRSAWWSGLVVGVGLSGYLAVHSIFEWMWRLLFMLGPDYMAASHWSVRGGPIFGFAGLKIDVLSVGAVRLARLGHPGLLYIFIGVGGIGLVAMSSLWRLVRRRDLVR